MIKNKKGIVFGVVGLLYLLGIIILLGMLIWGAWKLSDVFVAFWDFLKKWWWAIGLTLFWFSPTGRAILKWLLSKLGIRV